MVHRAQPLELPCRSRDRTRRVGDAAVTDVADIAVYAATDPNDPEAGFLLGQLNDAKVNLAPNALKTYTVALLIPDDIDAGTFSLVAVLAPPIRLAS